MTAAQPHPWSRAVLDEIEEHQRRIREEYEQRKAQWRQLSLFVQEVR